MVIPQEGYLEIRLPATESAELVKGVLEEIVRICSERRPPRLLVDFTLLQNNPTTLQRYDYGMIASRLSPYVGRAAALAQAVYIDPEKLGVTVARNRGLPAEIFTDRAKALAWLLGE
jgi:hypothetical protein